ncbi:ribosome small subunit-dependent GTPase A, partial [Streptococcus pyogenes]
HEPGCAVKLALETGQVAQSRYDNYLQFLSEIENTRETYKKVSKKQ